MVSMYMYINFDFKSTSKTSELKFQIRAKHEKKMLTLNHSLGSIETKISMSRGVKSSYR